MTDFFVRLFTSEKADWLQEYYPSAFLLLSYIARHCRRTTNIPDGLEFGDCIIGEIETPRKCGLSTKEFRNARDKLIEFGMLEIVFHPKPEKTVKGVKIIFPQKRAIKRAIKSMVVNLCNIEIYDISFEHRGEQKVDQGANKGRPEVDKQRTEQKDKTVIEQQQTPTPLASLPVLVPVVGCSFSCLEGLVLSVEDVQKLCTFPEVDVIRAVQVRKEYKKTVDSEMGFLLRAIERKFQPKAQPQIQISELAKSNRDKLMHFKKQESEKLKIKDLDIKDFTDHAMFGPVRIPYEMEWPQFKELVMSTMERFNIIPRQIPKMAQVVEEGKIVHLQSACAVGQAILQQLEAKT